MMQLQISNPKMQKIFETQFHSNQEKFMEFIISFVKDNSKAVDDYFYKIPIAKQSKSFSYKKMNPMNNFYNLDIDKSDTEMTNPFKDVQDSVAFAKKLRENSYR